MQMPCGQGGQLSAPSLQATTVQDGTLCISLTAIRVALAAISGTARAVLIATACGVLQFVPGPIAWIEGNRSWEQNRREGLDYPPLLPEAAIDPSEEEVSLAAAGMLRSLFAQDQELVKATGLFDAILGRFSGVKTQQ
jgi:hypothetical protein